MSRLSKAIASATLALCATLSIGFAASPAAPTLADSVAPTPAHVAHKNDPRSYKHLGTYVAKVRQESGSYTVRTGDTLSSIGARVGRDWRALWWVNRKEVRNPNEIRTGQRLSMPLRSLSGAWLNRRALAAMNQPQIRTLAVTRSSGAAPAPPAQSSGPVTAGGSFEQCVIQRESGGDPTAVNPSSGASGLFGFLPSTWASLGLGYPGGASTAPVSVQEQGFNILYARDGTAPWAPYDGC